MLTKGYDNTKRISNCSSTTGKDSSTETRKTQRPIFHHCGMKPLCNTSWKRDVLYTSLPLNYSRFLTISSKISQIDGLIIKLYELLLSFGFIGPAILSNTSRCLTLAFAFPGESKSSDETRPGKVNPPQTLTLKADTL